MRVYSCLIVEDEPLAVEILQEYIQEIPFLELTAVAPNAVNALQIMQEKSIDVLFLDIHLPLLKGLDFLKTLKQQPHVIITTAYHQYALESYEFNVIDYLLKPIEFSRFLTAVNKIHVKEQPLATIQQTGISTERPFLFCTVNKKRIRIFLDELLCIESQKEYSKIITVSKTILTKLSPTQIETFLSSGNCMRVHRSFIVAIDKIDSYSAMEIEIGGLRIPIGRSYKELVQQALDGLSK